MADLMMTVDGADVPSQKFNKDFKKTWLRMIPALKMGGRGDFLLRRTLNPVARKRESRSGHHK